MRIGLDREQLSYLAGFFDGEGCVSPARHGTLSIQVSVAQKHPEVLRLYEAHWGGGIYKHKTGGYAWTCCSKVAVTFLEDIMPFLIEKREVALLGVQLGSSPSFRGRRPKDTQEEREARQELARRITELNHV